MTITATWEPYEEHGHLATRSNLPDSVFAFPNQRGDENRQLRLGLFVVRGRGQLVTVLSLKRTSESAVIRHPRV